MTKPSEALPEIQSLEVFVARINSLAFWDEFTFARNNFSPSPDKELELADNIVWFGDFALVLQLKERNDPTSDVAAEAKWFRNTVLKKAKNQIRDTHTYLATHPEIHITNRRGDSFAIKGADLNEIISVIVYVAGDALLDNSRQVQFYESQSAGFIHVLEANDYLLVLRTLRVPADIREYFAYRQEVLGTLPTAKTVITEADLLGGYIFEEDMPTPSSHRHFLQFVQDINDFDLSGLIGNIHARIEMSEGEQDYYRIMLEFAKLPRSIWRGIKKLLDYAFETVKAGEFSRPLRAFYPKSDCVFMVMPLDPELWGSDPEKHQQRVSGLGGFTEMAMYIHKASKGVGIQISRDGEDYVIDWAHIDLPWALFPEMDAKLAKFNPFREAKEQMVDSFFFHT